MNPATSTRSYYPALDGLRGFAIILVLCCHNFIFIPNFQFGWVGVDLFFVLSGFLITDILLKTKNSKNFLQNFYLRRVLRIFPLYYGAVLVFFIIVPFLGNLQIQYNYYQNGQTMLWLHLQNWLSITHITPTESMMLNHFWSLSVEEQFYLLWPLIIFSVKNERMIVRIVYVLLFVCIVSRFASWLYLGNGYTNYAFQYMTRLDGLCVGSLIATWRINSYEQTKKRLVTLAICVLGLHIALLILAKTAFPSFPYFNFVGYSSIAVIFGIIVYNAIEKQHPISRILLENAFIKFIGKISYGLYVYHWPILAFFKIYLLDKIVKTGLSRYSGFIIISVLALIVAVIVSIISYYFFERKLLALKDIIIQEGFFAKARKKLVLLFNPSSAR